MQGFLVGSSLFAAEVLWDYLYISGTTMTFQISILQLILPRLH
jgi:hypothetical protein